MLFSLEQFLYKTITILEMAALMYNYFNHHYLTSAQVPYVVILNPGWMNTIAFSGILISSECHCHSQYLPCDIPNAYP
ncbi:hypothetical protein CR513_54396 [Mucuna pruriens]|uniref:Uncharacterized protein n=1 Tax=Mucuna pruriens TaxID=157652 RepID=A0A371EL58_MUCPR|nr:hypothetical protein CR513_54396 [Mucuna pruriens]